MLTKTARIKAVLRHLGQVRDGLLVLGGGLYFAGYTAWAIFASIHNLGPLPALQAQYFVSGVPVILILVVVLFIIRFARRFYTWHWPRWLEKRPLKARQWFFVANVLAAAGLAAYYFYSLRPLLHNTEPSPLYTWKLLIIGLLMLAAILLIRIPEPWAGRLRGGLQSLLGVYANYFYLVLGLAGVLIALLYLKALYPLIPPEMGGSRPRLAVLDLVGEKLSAQTLEQLSAQPLEQLVARDVMVDSSDVFSSRPVWIYFSSNTTILLTSSDPKNEASDLIELDRSAVVAIRWCREQRPKRNSLPSSRLNRPTGTDVQKGVRTRRGGGE